KELAFFGQTLSSNNLQEQVTTATFLVDTIEDPEEEETKCNLKIIERFDIENVICLNVEIFQDNESDIENEEYQDYNSNAMEYVDEDISENSNIDISENSNINISENSNIENEFLPIALRKIC
ncbi:13385_t:CDS:1, partial [Racocetra persica]